MKVITAATKFFFLENGSPTTNDEGLLTLFTGMITRTLQTFDLSNGDRQMPTVRALAGATVEMNSIPKVPFNYNHRETIRRKRTLLELSSMKSNLTERSTNPINSRRFGSPITQYRRSRANAKFFSTPDHGSSTLPRNYDRSRLPSNAMQVPIRARSPSLQEPHSKLRSSIFQDSQINNSKIRTSPSSSPKSANTRTPSLPNQRDNATLSKLSKYSSYSAASSVDDEPLRFFPSPDARESPDGEHNQILADMNIDKAGAETQLRKSSQGFDTLGLSSDSGLFSKSQDVTKDDVDSDSTLGDDVSLDRLIPHGYELDNSSPSVSECDLYTPWNTHDSVSLPSRASNGDSPIRRILSDEGPRHRLDRYETNQTQSLPKSPSILLNEPKINTLNEIRLRKTHSRNISTG